jgi:hypothetical protein
MPGGSGGSEVAGASSSGSTSGGAGAGGASAGLGDAGGAGEGGTGGVAYECPGPGAAFEVEYAYGILPTTVVPWQPERWCASDDDCAKPEACFLVAPERGVCTAPAGVSCSEYEPFAKSSGAAGAGGTGGASACGEQTEQCFYQRCSGFLTYTTWLEDCDRQVCLQPGCSSSGDCDAGETCVPGWVGPTTANQCMAAACKSDADCADSPCGRCVFGRSLAWPFNSNPTVAYLGATCL